MKSIRTTIYINESSLNTMKRLSSKNKLSVNDIIIQLLQSNLPETKKNLKLNQPVKYQEDDKLKKWKTQHVRLSFSDYELFIDMRKFYKKSVSLLLRIAIENFLQKKVTTTQKDNYYYNNYQIHSKNGQNCIIWLIYWKNESKLRKKE